MSELVRSIAIEELLVSRNLRHMQIAREALKPGYCLRAATYLHEARGTVIIGTGFPVAGSFETDGPVGAMALYRTLERLGKRPLIACGGPLSRALSRNYEILPLTARDVEAAQREARQVMQTLKPSAVVAIECPGAARDGRYYNMRGEDISADCAFFDPFMQLACPAIAIGDGGNEIGMGVIAGALADLDIQASVTPCDELVVADISNWGAYGLIALLARWSDRDLFSDVSHAGLLQYLLDHGAVDGVTGEHTLTEDGLPAADGQRLIDQLRACQDD